MKPETFVRYICQDHRDISFGWVSGASFEVHVQVRLDNIVRSHLTSKIGNVHGTPVQGEGERLTKEAWGKMREIAYPVLNAQSNQMICDFYINNERFIWNATTQSYTLKTTKYYIELKCESPQTKQFGGKSFDNAYNEDVDKLKKAKSFETSQPPLDGQSRRRYWMVMIAFSPDNIRRMNGRGRPWTFSAIVANKPSMFVGLDEI